MKVALLADIHANLPALEAVLTHADAHGIDAVWNLGDMVGYGAQPNEVLDLLARRKAVSIAGNYDRKVLFFPDKRDKWRKTKSPKKVFAFRWTYRKLTAAHRALLERLPERRRRTVAGRRVLLVHGSPASASELLGPKTPRSRMAELARTARADVVACAHTHRPMRRRVAGVLFVNPGSVGRPNDSDARACYAIMDCSTSGLRVRQFRVPYNVSRAAAAIRAEALPEEFAQMVVQAKNLEQLSVATFAPDDIPPCRYGKNTDRLQAAMRFAEQCGCEVPHAAQVTRLALRLFDQMYPLHSFSGDEHFLLQCAAVLHDIGVPVDVLNHHKVAMRMILDAEDLPLKKRQRAVVAAIARYHRKVLPSMTHKPYAALSDGDRYRVRILAGILRVADGLDRSHANVVRSLSAYINHDEITLRCDTAENDAEDELWAARKKGRLFEDVFNRKLTVLVGDATL